MARCDRLTTLMERFSLTVAPTSVEEAALVVLAGPDGAPQRVLFRTTDIGFDVSDERLLFCASVDWGGGANPLMAALPSLVEFDLSQDAQTAGLVELIAVEFAQARCGSGSVVNRLGEVLIVRLLRAQIEAGTTRVGLLAGLSDARISRAIVAMHAAPGRAWNNADLAQIAGLSLSRFAEQFGALVGEPPAAYLRRWRLILARQDVAHGERIDRIARRYGYGSPEGFARAFKRHFGENPVALRPKPVGLSD